MLAAISRTIRSSRGCGSSASAINSRSRFRRTRGPAAMSRIRQFSNGLCRQHSNATRHQPNQHYLLLIQTVDGMQSANREFRVWPVDQDRDLDLGGGDGADVDGAVGERLEGGGG